MPTITRRLRAWSDGDKGALDDVMTLVYEQLRHMAGRHLRHEGCLTICPTELVHEVFLKLTQSQQQSFRDRVHFYGAAAEMMRRVLIDLARKRNAAKREAMFVRVDVECLEVSGGQVDLIALDDALEKLAALDPRQAEVVQLRFFGGLSMEQTAQALNISETTVRRDWLVAKAWLLREMSRTRR